MMAPSHPKVRRCAANFRMKHPISPRDQFFAVTEPERSALLHFRIHEDRDVGRDKILRRNHWRLSLGRGRNF